MASVTIPIPSTKSWKTTLLGALMSVAIYLSNLDGYEGTIGKFLVMALPLVWGFVQKDANVTGGTVVQPTVVNVPTVASTVTTTVIPPPAQ